MASERVLDAIRRNGADWYAEQVVKPLFEVDSKAPRLVQEHMAGFPEPLRTECREAVEALRVVKEDGA